MKSVTETVEDRAARITAKMVIPCGVDTGVVFMRSSEVQKSECPTRKTDVNGVAARVRACSAYASGSHVTVR